MAIPSLDWSKRPELMNSHFTSRASLLGVLVMNAPQLANFNEVLDIDMVEG